MAHISLKNRILERLQELRTWVHRGQIEERVKEWGYLAENGNRRCRELAEEGLIERKEEKGSVLYRYKNDIIQAPKPQRKVEFINGKPTLISSVIQPEEVAMWNQPYDA